MDDAGSLSVLDRMTEVLRAFDQDDPGISLSELARRSGLAKSTVSRVVSALVLHGYLERDGRLLHLGLRVFELGQLARDPREVRIAALPTMLQLRDRTGESVHLGLRDGDEIVCVGLLRGREPIPREVRMGARLRSHTAGVGDIALHHVPPPPVRIAGDDPRGTTVVLACASCRFGESDSVLSGEISVTGRADGFDLESIAPLLRAAAKTLTRRLSGGMRPVG